MFKATYLHEARHSYQGAQSAIPGKDQDQDFLVNSVYAVSPSATVIDSTDVRPVCNNLSANPSVENRAYHGDSILDKMFSPDYASFALEEDAYVFATNNDH